MIQSLTSIFSKITKSKTYLRPPGAVPEDEFISRCIKCSKCAQVCSYNSIKILHLNAGKDFGTPVIEAKDIPCYLCMECPRICPSGALDNALVDKEKVRMGLAVIDESKCLPFLGVICRSCYDECPIHRVAIVLEDELLPRIDAETCTGCGICESVCPAEEIAITIKPLSQLADKRK
ncbi:MAG: hypothetical protein B6244_13955 [Candidatus Cloacimonetes bacterium 4572_55]|nr:MAG: hypothetical protein B6244_13955 [Candidatus Cloacimonetes bacterium 4572_55]